MSDTEPGYNATSCDTSGGELQLSLGHEDGIEAEAPDTGLTITQPYDPTKIRVETRLYTVDLLVGRVREGEIDLAPGFQRKAGIWNESTQSRLIESLLIRIPLPAFYLDASDETRWIMVDGLQRTTAMKRFILDGDLRLQDLEFLTELDGKTFSQLPRNWQRRILETQITLYLIGEGTPPEVRFTVFRRINTRGLPLSAQEIRHALNQGAATQLLQELATSREFLEATGHTIRNDRMADRECVLRALAFLLRPYDQYRSKDFDGFLNETMRILNASGPSELSGLSGRLRRTMDRAAQVLGKDAFRKIDPQGRKLPINRALLESWCYHLDRISEDALQVLVRRQGELRQAVLCRQSDVEFSAAISMGTGEPLKVRRRFEGIGRVIEEVLQCSDN